MIYNLGWVFIGPAENEDDEMMMSNFMRTYDSEYGWGGFKRPERLDVKKPGPGFNTNNFAFNVSLSPNFKNRLLNYSVYYL